MITLKNRMIGITNDSKDFYHKNPLLRGMDSGGSCVLKDEDTGNMCAIGRQLAPSDFKHIEKLESSGDIGGQDITEVYPILENPKITDLPLKFWRDLQGFHDGDSHWNINGITKDGIKYFKNMKRKINRGSYRVKKKKK